MVYNELYQHQRNFRVIDNLKDRIQQQMTETLNKNDNEEDIVDQDVSHFSTEENFPDLKKVIKLPKSSLQL